MLARDGGAGSGPFGGGEGAPLRSQVGMGAVSSPNSGAADDGVGGEIGEAGMVGC